MRGDSPSAAPSLVRAWGQSLPTQNVPTYALTLTRYLENNIGAIRTGTGA